jgi:hypothetical protein
MTKTLCVKSHVTKSHPPNVPTAKRVQNQRAKRAPASSAIPSTTGTTKAATPMSGFGNPSSDPCGDSMTVAQEMNGLMSHESDAPGFSSRFSRSRTRTNDPIHPTTPVTRSRRARERGCTGARVAVIRRSWQTEDGRP